MKTVTAQARLTLNGDNTIGGVAPSSSTGTTAQTFSNASASSSTTGIAFLNPWVALQAGTDLVVGQTAIASNPIGRIESSSADALLFAALNTATPNGPKPSWAA